MYCLHFHFFDQRCAFFCDPKSSKCGLNNLSNCDVEKIGKGFFEKRNEQEPLHCPKSSLDLDGEDLISLDQCIMHMMEAARYPASLPFWPFLLSKKYEILGK